tara:strand:+ start:3128 stop:3775 length:648 start_codon:yes stop_codon:yes gene_type:complete
MNMIETIKHKFTGKPRVVRDGGRVILTASHRLPSSGKEELTVLRIVSVVGTAAILVAYYRPETAIVPDSNVLLEQANTIIAGLSNAFGKLREVAEQQTLDVPLESLRGWAAALAFLGGTFVFRHSGLFDPYTWLTNREHVTVTIDDEHLSMGRGMFRFPKRVARGEIQDVLILPNHRTGHDVMVQHNGDLLRVASIYGDLTKPTLLRLRLMETIS